MRERSRSILEPSQLYSMGDDACYRFRRSDPLVAGAVARLDAAVRTAFGSLSAVTTTLMTSRNELRKVAAQCRSCGAIHAAEEWPNGSLRPIGQRGGCGCGRSALQIVEHRDADESTSVG